MASKHPSTLCTWTFSHLLSITIPDSGCVCIGFAPSKNRSCHNPIAAHNVKAAKVLIGKLPHLAMKPDELKTRLVELACLILCKRNHQNQAQGLAERWYGEILEERRRKDELKEPAQLPFRGFQTVSRQLDNHLPELVVKQEMEPDNCYVEKIPRMQFAFPVAASRQTTDHTPQPSVNKNTPYVPREVQSQQSAVLEIPQKHHVDKSEHLRQSSVDQKAKPGQMSPSQHCKESKKAQPNIWDQGFERPEAQNQACCNLQHQVASHKRALDQTTSHDALLTSEQETATGNLQCLQSTKHRVEQIATNQATAEATFRVQPEQIRSQHRAEQKVVCQAAGGAPTHAQRRAEQELIDHIAADIFAPEQQEQMQTQRRAERKATEQAVAHTAAQAVVQEHKVQVRDQRRMENEKADKAAALATKVFQSQQRDRRRAEQERIKHIATHSVAEALQGRIEAQGSIKHDTFDQATAHDAAREPQGGGIALQQEQRDTEEAKIWSTAWARYERGWTALPSLQAIQGDIPWPVQDGRESSVNEENVRDFFDNAPRLFQRDEKAFLRMLGRQIVRWLSARTGISFPEADQAALAKMTVVRKVIHDFSKGTVGVDRMLAGD